MVVTVAQQREYILQYKTVQFKMVKMVKFKLYILPELKIF